jgi:hypothetical protein
LREAWAFDRQSADVRIIFACGFLRSATNGA